MTDAVPSTIPKNPPVAAAWMLGALTSFALMAVAGREISKELDTFQLMFFRSVIGVLIVVAIAAALPGGLRRLKTERLGLHVLRNGFHFVGQFSWFFAITVISLAEVFALEFTTPIWVALLAPLILGERMTKIRAAAVVIGFAGVLIVLRPGATEVGIGHIAMLLGALCFASALLATKSLTATETPLAILFWMTLIQLPMGLIGSIGDFVIPGPVTGVWLVVVAVCGLTAHFCIAQAFRHADATTVVPMDFMRLPLIAVVGMLLYAEPLDPFVFLGGAVILAGNYINIRGERRRR
jgi:drug/metabolite transporter (DMT)-like permease